MDYNKLMEELQEMNANELIEKLAKSEIKKEILIKIFELKEEGKSSDEIIEVLKKYLSEN
ncbi:hypothetical protein [Anaerococcus sp. AGMB09787]|uniref:hypothetical protein n=1 Tax=Anaerococcus sp. AGMB09787 TaxID=2922869 RepID=UPI001FAE7938|nr:hypothetical protein [Anaerococcus sp. AGMB09787]